MYAKEFGKISYECCLHIREFVGKEAKSQSKELLQAAFPFRLRIQLFIFFIINKILKVKGISWRTCEKETSTIL